MSVIDDLTHQSATTRSEYCVKRVIRNKSVYEIVTKLQVKARVGWVNKVYNHGNLKFGLKLSTLQTFKSKTFAIYMISNSGGKAIFLIKNQPRDNIINPKFEVQFSAVKTLERDTFTIYISSIWRKKKVF